MTESPDTDRTVLVQTLRELAWTVHRSAPARAGGGPIPTTELALLKQVLETPGATVGELSRVLGLRQPNTSAALRVLVQRGFVVRETHPDDRRVARIVPTEAARAEHEAIAAAWAGELGDAVETLDPEQRRALDDAAGALAALLEALRRPAAG